MYIVFAHSYLYVYVSLLLCIRICLCMARARASHPMSSQAWLIMQLHRCSRMPVISHIVTPMHAACVYEAVCLPDEYPWSPCTPTTWLENRGEEQMPLTPAIRAQCLDLYGGAIRPACGHPPCIQPHSPRGGGDRRGRGGRSGSGG